MTYGRRNKNCIIFLQECLSSPPTLPHLLFITFPPLPTRCTYNKFLTPIFLYKYVSIHTQLYRTLSSLPNPGRSKYVFIDTQSFQSLSSLPKNGRFKYVFIDTQSCITLYPLPNTGRSMYVSMCVSMWVSMCVSMWVSMRVSMCVSIHTQRYETVCSLSNNGRSKYMN